MPGGGAGDPFDALGDPTRREILRLLSEGDKPVHEIAAALPISRPAVSRHLRLLKDAGMVAERAEGNRRIYHLRDEGCAPSRSTSRACGARRPPGSGCWPRTPTRAAMTAPLRLSFDVDCPRQHAFAVWTSKIGTWWPRDHTVSGDPDGGRPREPQGGRIYERTPAGVRHEWGEVTVWEPPRRLAYLWHLGRERADATEVEITFVDEGGDAHPHRDRTQRVGASGRRGGCLAGPEPWRVGCAAAALRGGRRKGAD